MKARVFSTNVLEATNKTKEKGNQTPCSSIYIAFLKLKNPSDERFQTKAGALLVVQGEEIGCIGIIVQPSLLCKRLDAIALRCLRYPSLRILVEPRLLETWVTTINVIAGNAPYDLCTTPTLSNLKLFEDLMTR